MPAAADLGEPIVRQRAIYRLQDAVQAVCNLALPSPIGRPDKDLAKVQARVCVLAAASWPAAGVVHLPDSFPTFSIWIGPAAADRAVLVRAVDPVLAYPEARRHSFCKSILEDSNRMGELDLAILR